MMEAAKEWADGGFPHVKNLQSVYGSWELEHLHKDKNVERLGVTYGIKSSQNGDMPWHDRLYFRVEKGNVFFVKVKDNHI